MISKEYMDLLIKLGTDKVGHSQGSFYEHLIGTHDLLKSWGNKKSVCLAGLFHSIYGTEDFTDSTLAYERRQELQRIIGKEAEHLVYLFCTTQRRSFFNNLSALARGGQLQVLDRQAQQMIPVSKETLVNLLELEVANLIDQAPPPQQIPDSTRSTMLGICSSLTGIVSVNATDAMRKYLTC